MPGPGQAMSPQISRVFATVRAPGALAPNKQPRWSRLDDSRGGMAMRPVSAAASIISAAVLILCVQVAPALSEPTQTSEDRDERRLESTTEERQP